MIDETETGSIDALRIAASKFMKWSDGAENDAEAKAHQVSRSIGLQRMANYVHCLSKVAALHPDVGKHELEPARRIAIALNDAGWGFPTPLFRHEDAMHEFAWRRWGGRKSPSRLSMEGRAVGCAWFLVEAGKIPIRRACRMVARCFAMYGHKGLKGGELGGATIRAWFDALVQVTGERADDHPYAGMVTTDKFADMYRQADAAETFVRLTKRHLVEANITDWFNIELRTIAASCSVMASSRAMEHSHYGGI